MGLCLECEYEPDWEEWVGIEYKRCYGKCKYPIPEIKYPAIAQLMIRSIERFSDDSGIPERCKCFKKKEKINE